MRPAFALETVHTTVEVEVHVLEYCMEHGLVLSHP